jgi:hypothetical protein
LVGPACPLDMVRPCLVGLRAEEAWEVVTSVKATGLSLGWREKPIVECGVCPYRKPTLVGRGKYPEVGERTLVKELGKLTP